MSFPKRDSLRALILGLAVCCCSLVEVRMTTGTQILIKVIALYSQYNKTINGRSKNESVQKVDGRLSVHVSGRLASYLSPRNIHIYIYIYIVDIHLYLNT